MSALLTLPHLAHAVRVQPRTMRTWLGSFELHTPRTRRGAWLRACPADAVRLAVFSQLIVFGYTMIEAASVVRRWFDPHLARAGDDIVAADWQDLIRATAGLRIAISRDADGHPALPRGRPGVEFPTVSFDLAALIRDVHRRASQWAAP